MGEGGRESLGPCTEFDGFKASEVHISKTRDTGKPVVRTKSVQCAISVLLTGPDMSHEMQIARGPA